MSLHHCLLSWSYHPLRLVKSIGRPIGLASPHHLRILLCHDIAPHDQENFCNQLRWLARRWNFVTPQKFAAMISRKEPIQGLNLLLTFDDGFFSNRIVAEKILKPMGIKALFFVVSDFVALTNRDEARHFIAQHIEPGRKVSEIPEHLYNMSWSDLEVLLKLGHCVGGHTRTHARLSQIETDIDLEREIIHSGDTLEKRLGVSIEHFAYTFGDLASFSKKALTIAQQRYRFIYSGLRGDNSTGVSPFALRRDSVGGNDSTALLGAFLEGAADPLYARSCHELDIWS